MAAQDNKTKDKLLKLTGIKEMMTKDKYSKYYKFVVYLVIVVLLNLVSVSLFFRLDLTANGSYSLSRASKKVVNTLSEPLTIKVFFTEKLPAPHNSTERYLRDLLSEYGIHGNRNFNYTFYNVSPKEGDTDKTAKENREMAKNYGIYPIQIQLVEKDEVKFQKAYMGMAIIHGDIVETIPSVTSTDGLEYKITSIIKKMNNKISALLNISGKIQAKLIMSSSLKIVGPYLNISDVSGIPKKVEKVIEKLNGRHYGKLKYTYLDPTGNDKVEKEIEKYNVLSLKWPADPVRKLKEGKAFVGLVLEYGKRTEEIPVLNVVKIPIFGTRYEIADMEELEKSIASLIENLIDINSKIGYLADHKTLSLTKPYRPRGMPQMRQKNTEVAANFNRALSESYSIKNVKLKEGIPNGLECLIIAGPKERFSEYELFQIDQFLMKGKSVAVLLDTFNEVRMPQQMGGMYGRQRGPQYIPINTGLENLISHYGVSVKSSYLLDERCWEQVIPQQYGGGKRKMYMAPLIKSDMINSKLDFVRSIKELLVLKVSPLEIAKDKLKDNKIQASLLFSSSKKSWETEGRINLNPMFLQPPTTDDKKKSRPLAYLLEGNFKSYFDGKTIPEKPTANDTDSKKKKSGYASKIKGEGEFITKGKRGKIFLIGTSGILKDEVFDPKSRVQVLKQNTVFVMNVIDYLNNNSDYAVMRSKTQGFNPLADSKALTKRIIKVFNIAGLPVIVILVGLFIWLRRESRKRLIQSMYQRKQKKTS